MLCALGSMPSSLEAVQRGQNLSLSYGVSLPDSRLLEYQNMAEPKTQVERRCCVLLQITGANGSIKT